MATPSPTPSLSPVPLPEAIAETQPMRQPTLSDADDVEAPRARPAAPGCCRCTKQGKMMVLCECDVNEEDQFLMPTDNDKIRWMVGPYWNMLIITYVVILVITILVYDTVIPKRRSVEIVVGLSLTSLTLLFLSLTAFSDPGIFPKHERPKGPNWSYSGQAQSFRPPNVIFCRESMLLIEDYDHFCPWSGTVIGGKNLKFFHCFVSCLVLTMIYDVVVLSLALKDQGDEADDLAYAQ